MKTPQPSVSVTIATIALVLACLAPLEARAQDAPDASADAGEIAGEDAGADAGVPTCPASDERGPCLESFKNAVCTLSTVQSGACVESACIKTESGAPALVCRADAMGDDGCCSLGGGNAASPAIATFGFGLWLRRRRKRFAASR